MDMMIFSLGCLVVAILALVEVRRGMTEHKEHIKARMRMLDKWKEQLDKDIAHEKYLEYIRNLPTRPNTKTS